MPRAVYECPIHHQNRDIAELPGRSGVAFLLVNDLLRRSWHGEAIPAGAAGSGVLAASGYAGVAARRSSGASGDRGDRESSGYLRGARGPAAGGAGAAGYDPDMLLALLVWAYANRVTSSRRIEGMCGTDLAFRVICVGGTLPDHATIARFRAGVPRCGRWFLRPGAGVVRAAGDGQARRGGAGRDEDRGQRVGGRGTGARPALAEAGRPRPWPRTPPPMPPRMSCSARCPRR